MQLQSLLTIIRSNTTVTALILTGGQDLFGLLVEGAKLLHMLS
jgi:hypothetical protein